MKKVKKTSLPSKIIFKTLIFFAKIFYKKTEIVGIERLLGGNKIIVSNHAQLNGPIIGELFMPENCYIWANGQMVRCREVHKYAMNDFFSYKSQRIQPIYNFASYLLAFLLPCVINNARTIPVYRDARIVSTFRATIKHLENGDSILIFPEKHEKYNNIVNKFQENFIDVARLYYKKTGIELTFLPMYVAPNMSKAYIGEGIRFDSNKSIGEERERISTYLSDEITKIGRSLPRHTVVPFDNISRKQYITNKDTDRIP